MILEQKPLSIAEVIELVGEGERQEEIKKFIKGFSKISFKKAGEMRAEFEGLGLLKLKNEHIAKLIDFMPEDAVDLNKIISDVSLDQDEVNKILEVVRKY
jgi:DNA-directed RNA polymerase subunit F